MKAYSHPYRTEESRLPPFRKVSKFRRFLCKLGAHDYVLKTFDDKYVRHPEPDPRTQMRCTSFYMIGNVQQICLVCRRLKNVDVASYDRDELEKFLEPELKRYIGYFSWS